MTKTKQSRNIKNKWHIKTWWNFQGSMQFPCFCLTAAKIWIGRPVLQLGYSSVLFGQAKENTSLRNEGRPTKIRKGLNFGFSFCMFFLLLWDYVNWAIQKGCLFHLRFSSQSLDFLLFHFCQLFLSLSFSHYHFRLLFPILTT